MGISRRIMIPKGYRDTGPMAQKKAIMKTELSTVIGIACLVGLVGGLMVGIGDSVAVILGQGGNLVLSDILRFTLYSVALYGAIGCIVMAVIGTIVFIIMRVGRYHVKNTRLAGILIFFFVMITVYVLFPIPVGIGDVTINLLMSTICGVALALLSVYVLEKGIKNEKLIATSISLLIWIWVLLYGIFGILWFMDTFSSSSVSLAVLALLVVDSLLAVGLYRLSLSVLRKYDSRKIRQAGWIALTVMASICIAVAVIGPFNADTSTAAEGLAASPTSENGIAAGSAGLEGKPNIIWIVMDTVREDGLSCYGYDRNTSPYIDRIASEGILYENAFSTAPWTLPSHASMFTGMFPSQFGTDAEFWHLESDFETIAEALRSYGYLTLLYSNNGQLSPAQNMAQGFDTYEITNTGKEAELISMVDQLKLRRYYIQLFRIEDKGVEVVIDDGAYKTNKVVKGWIADADRAEEPFFLFINYMEAHYPYHPPLEYALRFRPGNSTKSALLVSQDPISYITGRVKQSEEDFAILRGLYDAEISYLDFRMGELFDYLRELDIMNDTVLIITSDHGEYFGEHQLMGHVFGVYDTLIHVPLIIRYPPLFEAGMRVDEQVQLTDIFPTILDIVGIDRDSNDQIMGNSLIRDGQNSETTFAIAEHGSFVWSLNSLMNNNRKFDIAAINRRLKTVRDGEYKYIWSSDGRDELYNILNDPDELNNLIESEPEKASELKAYLIKWLNSLELYRPWMNLQ